MSMKRKAGAGGLTTASPAPKRSRKSGETSEEVTAKGLEFLDALRGTRDKSGRLVAATFESLPDRRKEPVWYEHVLMPLSVEIIQTKLEHGEYPTMTTLESDLKRMVFNWKDVYARTSEAHRDAEKVRKIVTLHFKYKGLNPHYVVDPDYVSFPTPLLAGDNKAGDNENSDIETPARDGRPRGRIVLRRPSQKIPAAPVSDEETPESQPLRLKIRLPRRSDVAEASVTGGEAGSHQPKRARIIFRRPSAPGTEVEKPRGISPALKMPPEAAKGFEGMIMTDAQEKILDEMIELEDETGISISGPFVNLPSRELKDYYATIKHPLSIKGAQKLVRGIKGREKHTGTTFLDTWQEFDEEVSHIWNNARLYNEDESEISKLAGKLEKYFNMRVQTAKKAVPDPVVPKLKISVSKQAETSGKSGFNSTDIPKAAVDEVSRKYGVDEDALRRQKELVANGVVGKLDPSTQASASPAPRATSEIKSTTPNGIAESSGQPLSNGKPRLDTSMPPPSTFPGVQPAVTRPPPPLRSEDIKKPWDTWKRSDRPEQYRWPYHTIKEILIISHPALNLGSRGYRWSLYPWPQFNYASDTIPMRKETSRILFSPLLIKPTRERPVVYHHVTLNGVRLQASSSAPRIPGGQASEEDNLYRPVYDIHLDITDVNELMVECYTCPSEVCDTKDVLFDKHMVNIQPR